MLRCWILEEGVDSDVEASEGESESETSSDTQTSTCSEQSNKSNRSNNSTCLTDDGKSHALCLCLSPTIAPTPRSSVICRLVVLFFF